MIYVITGKTGHGKTAYTTKWARSLLKNTDKRLYVNYKLYPLMMNLRKDNNWYEGNIKNENDRNDPRIRILYWIDYQDWYMMNKGTIFCDEGIIYFNARLWENLPHEIQIKLVQHRKDSLDLIVNVQHYTFIDKTIRMLAERYINVELKIGSPKFKDSWIPRIAKIVEHDLPTLNRCENLGIDPYNPPSKDNEGKYKIEPIYTEWFWIRKKIFKWYDTTQQVSESEPAPFRHIIRTCNHCGFQKVQHA